ncbi:hypothetical protein RI054_14g69600 [Pseudoscourfieldia marina]
MAELRKLFWIFLDVNDIQLRTRHIRDRDTCVLTRALKDLRADIVEQLGSAAYTLGDLKDQLWMWAGYTCTRATMGTSACDAPLFLKRPLTVPWQSKRAIRRTPS